MINWITEEQLHLKSIALKGLVPLVAGRYNVTMVKSMNWLNIFPLHRRLVFRFPCILAASLAASNFIQVGVFLVLVLFLFKMMGLVVCVLFGFCFLMSNKN